MHIHYALFEAFDETSYAKIFFDIEAKGFVVAHKLHGKYELKANKMIAILVARHGYRVILLGNQINVISADAMLDDEIWEFNNCGKSRSA